MAEPMQTRIDCGLSPKSTNHYRHGRTEWGWAVQWHGLDAVAVQVESERVAEALDGVLVGGEVAINYCVNLRPSIS